MGLFKKKSTLDKVVETMAKITAITSMTRTMAVNASCISDLVKEDILGIVDHTIDDDDIDE